jgi:hypothetical protein
MMDIEATKPGKKFFHKNEKGQCQAWNKVCTNQIFMAAVVTFVYAQNFVLLRMIDDEATKPGKKFFHKNEEGQCQAWNKVCTNQISMVAVVTLVYAQNFESCKE